MTKKEKGLLSNIEDSKKYSRFGVTTKDRSILTEKDTTVKSLVKKGVFEFHSYPGMKDGPARHGKYIAFFTALGQKVWNIAVGKELKTSQKSRLKELHEKFNKPNKKEFDEYVSLRNKHGVKESAPIKKTKAKAKK